MAHVTYAIRMHGERATTVPPSIPCVACTDASLGSMALPVSARPAVSFPTGIGRPRVAMYFPIPTGKGTPITDPGRWNRTRCMMVVSRYPCPQPSTQHPCDRTRWGRDIVAGADRISDIYPWMPRSGTHRELRSRRLGSSGAVPIPSVLAVVHPPGGCNRYNDLPRHTRMACRMPHWCHSRYRRPTHMLYRRRSSRTLLDRERAKRTKGKPRIYPVHTRSH
jgi:hypothetical protein